MNGNGETCALPEGLAQAGVFAPVARPPDAERLVGGLRGDVVAGGVPRDAFHETCVSAQNCKRRRAAMRAAHLRAARE